MGSVYEQNLKWARKLWLGVVAGVFLTPSFGSADAGCESFNRLRSSKSVFKIAPIENNDTSSLSWAEVEQGVACKKGPVRDVPGYQRLPFFQRVFKTNQEQGDSCVTPSIGFDAPPLQTLPFLSPLADPRGDRLGDFISEVDEFVEKKQYERFDPVALQSELLEANNKLGEARKKEQLDRIIHYEKSSRFAKKLKKGLYETADTVLFTGPSRKLYEAVKSYLAKKTKSLREKVTKFFSKEVPQKDVHLSELLPARNWEMTVVKTATGGLIVLVTIGGIVAGVLSSPAAVIPFEIANVGIDMAGGYLASRMEGKERREDILSSGTPKVVLDRNAVLKGLQAGIPLTGGAIIAGTSIAQIRTVRAGVIEAFEKVGAMNATVNAAFPMLPLVSLAYQGTAGLKSAVTAVAGFESSPEVMKKFEEAYQSAVRAVIKKRRDQIGELLAKAKELLTKEKALDVASHDIALLFAEKMNCLCKALAWIESFSEKAEKRFASRLSYLDKSSKKEKFWKNAKNKVASAFGINLRKRKAKIQAKNAKEAITHVLAYQESLEHQYHSLKRDYLLANSLSPKPYPHPHSQLHGAIKKVLGSQPTHPVPKHSHGIAPKKEYLDELLEETNFLRKRNEFIRAATLQIVEAQQTHTSQMVTLGLAEVPKMKSKKKSLKEVAKESLAVREIELVRTGHSWAAFKMLRDEADLEKTQDETKMKEISEKVREFRSQKR